MKCKLLALLSVIVLSVLLFTGCADPDFAGNNVSRVQDGVSMADTESLESLPEGTLSKEEQAAVEAIKVLQKSLNRPESTVIYKITYLPNNDDKSLLDIYIDFDALNTNNIRERMIICIYANDETIHEVIPTYIDLETTVDDIGKVFAEANRQLGITSQNDSANNS